jgi:hypothetical protein
MVTLFQVLIPDVLCDIVEEWQQCMIRVDGCLEYSASEGRVVNESFLNVYGALGR